MVKKLLTLIFAAFAICPNVSAAAYDMPIVKVYISDNFEDYSYPETSTGIIAENPNQNAEAKYHDVTDIGGSDINSKWSFNISGSTGKISLDTIDAQGSDNKQAICAEINGKVNTNGMGFRVSSNAFAKQIADDGYRYAIVGADIKNGTSADDMVPDLRFFRSQELKLGFETLLGAPVRQYEWNTYMFIIDSVDKKISVVVNGTLAPEKATPTESYFTNFGALAHSGFSMGAYYTVPSEPLKYWIDNVTVYGTNSLETTLESSAPKNGEQNAARSDEIVLKFNGPKLINKDEIEDSTKTVIFKEKDGLVAAVSAESIVYDDTANTLTIKLSDIMEESSLYTVNIPEIKNIFAQTAALEPIKFKTTGPLKIGISTAYKKVADGTALAALTNGMVEVTAVITNDDFVSMESGVIVAELKKDGETFDLAYRKVENLAVGASETASFAFTVPSADGYTFCTYVKDSLNGAYTFSKIKTLSSSGETSADAVKTETTLPTPASVSENENGVKFYSLTLGENGAREEISGIKGGLVECVADVTLSDGEKPYMICALKKDGMLIRCAYAAASGKNGANTYNVAMQVPEDEGYTIDVFVWKDFNGTGSYYKKTTLF